MIPIITFINEIFIGIFLVEETSSITIQLLSGCLPES